MKKLVILALLLAGCSDRTPPEPEQQVIRPAKLMTITSSGEALRYEYTARIEALQSIDLSFEVGGPLKQVAVREGETVAKGALVAALDPREFDLAVSESDVQLKLASQDLARKQKVFAQNGIAKSQVEDAESNFELQQVRLSQARERRADTRISAPFEAYVSRRYVDEGVNVRPGDPIVRLHDLTSLQVVINVPESLIATVNANQVLSAFASFAFIPDQAFELTYHENRGEADSLAQTYEVSFLMEKPADWNILPGMTATAVIQLQARSNTTMLVPASALVPMPDDTLAVWVFDPVTGFVKRRTIQTAAPREDGVPVLRGLKPGDQVVVAGASQLQEGMKVRPLE